MCMKVLCTDQWFITILPEFVCTLWINIEVPQCTNKWWKPCCQEVETHLLLLILLWLLLLLSIITIIIILHFLTLFIVFQNTTGYKKHVKIKIFLYSRRLELHQFVILAGASVLIFQTIVRLVVASTLNTMDLLLFLALEVQSSLSQHCPIVLRGKHASL